MLVESRSLTLKVLESDSQSLEIGGPEIRISFISLPTSSSAQFASSRLNQCPRTFGMMFEAVQADFLIMAQVTKEKSDYLVE